MKRVKLRVLNKYNNMITEKQFNNLKIDNIVVLQEIGTSGVLSLGKILETGVHLNLYPGKIWIKYTALTGKYQGQISFVKRENIIKIVTKDYPEYFI
jgi:hypothetical protein